MPFVIRAMLYLPGIVVCCRWFAEEHDGWRRWLVDSGTLLYDHKSRSVKANRWVIVVIAELIAGFSLLQIEFRAGHQRRVR